MCAQPHKNPPSQKHFMLYAYGIAILLGILCGASNITVLHQVGTAISEIFIRFFKFISLPIIALSIIVTLIEHAKDPFMKNVWKRTLIYTISTTLTAALVAFVLYLLIKPSNVIHIAPVAQDLGQTATKNYFDYLINVIPSSIFSPFNEHQVIGVLLIGLVTGVAIHFIPDDKGRESLSSFFKGAHGLFMTLTRWIVAIIPIGLFGFITTTVLQLKNGMDFKGIGLYLLVVVLANLVQGFVVLPLWLRKNGIAPFQMMRQMMPALNLAFFSKSSAGTLPLTMQTAERNAGVNPRISRFVLPLCTTINMNGCAAFIFTTVIYVMQNHGHSLSIPLMLLWIVIATIAAIGNAGVPMGCFFLSASLLASMDVPITLLGIILPFYSLIDMLETSLNVWSDACVAKVVDERSNHQLD